MMDVILSPAFLIGAAVLITLIIFLAMGYLKSPPRHGLHHLRPG